MAEIQHKLANLSQTSGFSVARLMDFLMALNYDIEIIIRKKPRSTKPGRIRVSAA